MKHTKSIYPTLIRSVGAHYIYSMNVMDSTKEVDSLYFHDGTKHIIKYAARVDLKASLCHRIVLPDC